MRNCDTNFEYTAIFLLMFHQIHDKLIFFGQNFMCVFILGEIWDYKHPVIFLINNKKTLILVLY